MEKAPVVVDDAHAIERRRRLVADLEARDKTGERGPSGRRLRAMRSAD